MAYTPFMDEDIIPDYVMSRLPVRTTTELSLYITKLIDYETRRGEPWTSQFTMLLGDLDVTNNDPVQVRAIGHMLREVVPADFDIYEVFANDYLGDPNARQAAALAEFNAGRGIIDVIGNTSLGSLAYMINFDCPGPPPCFQGGMLTNTNRCPVLLNASCEGARYAEQLGQPRSIAEQLLFIPGSAYKGVVAVLGAVHYVRSYEAAVLNKELYQTLPLAAHVGLGQIAWATKDRHIRKHPTFVESAIVQELLGEPLIKLSWDAPDTPFETTIEPSRPIPWQNKLLGAPVNMSPGGSLRIIPGDEITDALDHGRCLRLTGEDLSGADSKLEFTAFDMSWLITSNSYLSCWLQAAVTPADHGHVFVDLITASGARMSSWSSPPGSAICDQFGTPVTPSTHRVEPAGQWRHFYVDLSRMQGETIKKITLRYDDGEQEAGVVRAYLDGLILNRDLNEFVDGSFEKDFDGDNRPDFWSGAGLNDAGQIARISYEPPRHGERCIELYDDLPGGGALCQAITVKGAGPVSRVLSFQAKAMAQAQLIVRIEDRNTPNPPLYVQTFNIGTSWQTFDHTVVLSSTSEYKDLYVKFIPATQSLFYFLDAAELRPPQAIAVPASSAKPLALQQSWPNPMRGAATIPFSVSKAGSVQIRIYDVSGRLVRTLLDERVSGPKEGNAVWDARSDRGHPVPAGVYFYELMNNGRHLQKKLVVLE